MKPSPNPILLAERLQERIELLQELKRAQLRRFTRSANTLEQLKARQERWHAVDRRIAILQQRQKNLLEPIRASSRKPRKRPKRAPKH